MVRAVLGKMPIDARRMALLYAAVDVILTQTHSAPVLCAKGRRRIVLRLIELGIAEVPADVADAVRRSHAVIEGLEGYVGVAGLTFTSKSIDQLAQVKWNEKVRAYAGSFQGVLLGGSGEGDLDALLESMADAWSSSESPLRSAGPSRSQAGPWVHSALYRVRAPRPVWRRWAPTASRLPQSGGRRSCAGTSWGQRSVDSSPSKESSPSCANGPRGSSCQSRSRKRRRFVECWESWRCPPAR